MNIINEEILAMKTRLDKLLMSFNHAIDFDKSVYDIIKETRIRTKKLLLETNVIKYKNSIQEIKSKEIEEQIDFFLEIYESIEMGLEKITINFLYDNVVSSNIIRSIITDINNIEDLVNKLQDELINTNNVLQDLEKTVNEDNELMTINFKNHITKKDLESFKGEIKIYLDGINDKLRNYEIKKINFS